MPSICQHRLSRIVILSFFLGAFFSPFLRSIQAADSAYIPVGTAKTKKAVIAFPDIRSQNDTGKSLGKTLSETVVTDLNFMDLFKFLDASAFVEDPSKAGIAPQSFKFPDWTGIGTEFLIKSSLSIDPNQNVTFEAHLYDTFGAKQILAKKYTAPTRDIKTVAHTFANDVVQTLTGSPGIFLTKIDRLR